MNIYEITVLEYGQLKITKVNSLDLGGALQTAFNPQLVVKVELVGTTDITDNTVEGA